MSDRLLAELEQAPHLRTFYLEHFYGKVFDEGVLPRRIKEIVRLRLSLLHDCPT